MSRKANIGPCSISDCDNPAAHLGWCNSHYQRWRKYGDPAGGGPLYAIGTNVERFEKKVDKSGCCWLWLGSCNKWGYGQFKDNVARKMVKAHRFSYELYVGPIPEGLIILHSCDNPPCVNPAHLRPGTDIDNVHDMIGRGRHRSQQYQAGFKITDKMVFALRSEWAGDSPRSNAEIARALGVSAKYIGDIKSGKKRAMAREGV